MPGFKFTLEFEASIGSAATAGAKAGWTESWYLNIAGVLAEANVYAAQYLGERKKLLTPGWTCTGIRVSSLGEDFTPNRMSSLVHPSPAAGKGTYGAGDPNVDEQPYDAVEISVVTNLGGRRNFQMRGIGQDVIGASGRFLNPPRWVTAFGAWQRFVITNPPNQIRVRTNLGSWQLLSTWIGQVGSPAGATPTTPIVDVFSDTPVPQGAQVGIQGVQGLTRINGVWRVAKNSSSPAAGQTRIQLASKRRTSVAGVPTVQGRLSAWIYGLQSVVVMSASHGVSRKTGRPTQLTRGRRSNRA